MLRSRKDRCLTFKLVALLFINLLPLCVQSDSSITPEDVSFFGSFKINNLFVQVVDKNQQSEETVLNNKDFENVPDKEIDLRKIGIQVPDDPTLGQKTEGDIAIPNLKRFMDDYPNLGRNAIRQSYR